MNNENIRFITGISGIICYLLFLLWTIWATFNYTSCEGCIGNFAPMILIALIYIPILSFILGLMYVKNDLEVLKEDLKEFDMRWLD